MTGSPLPGTPVAPLASVLPHRRTPPMPGTRGSRIAALPGLGPRDNRNHDRDNGTTDDAPPRDLPDFLDAVDAVLDTRETGESPRMKIFGCPTYLLVEYRLIQSRTGCDIGAGLAACMAYGTTQLSDHVAIRAFDDLRKQVDQSDHMTLPLVARTTIHKLFGNPHRPGITYQVTIPCGDREVVHFRLPKVYRAKIQNRASHLGVSVSPFAALTLGLGLLEYSDSVDPESRRTIERDLKELISAVENQTEQLKVLVEMYMDKYR